jgi:hypothetical protein
MIKRDMKCPREDKRMHPGDHRCLAGELPVRHCPERDGGIEGRLEKPAAVDRVISEIPVHKNGS